jgi:integrase/recombinase XerD
MGTKGIQTAKHLRRRAKDKRGGQLKHPVELVPVGMALQYPAYVESLAVRNYAELTQNSRSLHLVAFLQWCQERDLFEAKDITRLILESYQRHMHRHRKKNGKPLGFSTQRGRLVTIKDFFRWLCRSDEILHNPASELEMPRQEKPLPKMPMTANEAERVLNVPNLSDPLGVRDRALMEVFYSTGIRRMEAVKLQLEDIQFERRVLAVRLGKGKKDRIVPIGERALSWLEKYLDEVRPELVYSRHEKSLFLSAYGEALAPDYLSRLVIEYIKKSEVGKSGGCHLFRHTCATLMLENGADIRFIQQLLGHANLNTTQIYTQVSIAQLQRVHDMTHPAKTRG